MVALPARHPLAGADTVDLAQLAELPLHLTEHRSNPPLVDLVVGACRDAGFEPAQDHPTAHSRTPSRRWARVSPVGRWCTRRTPTRCAAVGWPSCRCVPRPGFGVPRGSPCPPCWRCTAPLPPERVRLLLEACREVARDDRDS
ncbi:hypothetical protein [Kitasatospora sp. NPDC058190]|uniref:hypothetical protein n=1 Tax=Kitasatospora sp. NPDC058190 TaxID=3346371 RepID=UPI0036D9024E